MDQPLPLDERSHKYGTGSCSDRIQALLQSTSNGTNQLVYRANNLHVKVDISHRAPGRYSSRFRICAAFVELYCLTHTKPNQ